ncbi:MAG: type 1 glutamine amidotransferase [Usitatibacteraceae bacterium]
MKPIAIFRFSPEDGPGYFASFLDRHSIPWTLFKLDEGAIWDRDLDDYAGFVFMGGPMSVNDRLPYFPALEDLIRRAIDKDLPCVGHCLGGQLMAKALGGRVTPNRVKEIGWNAVDAIDTPMANDWLGKDASSFTTFQWHGETFSIPPGATRILTSSACENQAFVIGKSLAMQCHIEMTPDMVEDWSHDWAAENADPTLPSIQTPERMLSATDANMPGLRQLADRLYARWLEGAYGKLRTTRVGRA